MAEGSSAERFKREILPLRPTGEDIDAKAAEFMARDINGQSFDYQYISTLANQGPAEAGSKGAYTELYPGFTKEDYASLRAKIDTLLDN